MAVFHPYEVPAPTLSSLPLEELCKEGVLGVCTNEKCSKNHALSLVSDDEEFVFVRGDPFNTLSNVPRPQISREHPFDEDGAGSSAKGGPRHDNDFSRITEIRIMPTVDEVRPFALSTPVTNALLPRSYVYDHLTFHAKTRVSAPIYNDRQETPQGNRYSFLQDVKFESMMFNDLFGTIFRVSFECPYKLRGQSLLSSSLLEKSKMCALLAIHDETKEVNVLLFEVYQRETTVGSRLSFRDSMLILLDCLKAHWLDFSRWRAINACGQGENLAS